MRVYCLDGPLKGQTVETTGQVFSICIAVPRKLDLDLILQEALGYHTSEDNKGYRKVRYTMRWFPIPYSHLDGFAEVVW